MSEDRNKKVRIVDLFAGLGGFHLGLSQVQGWDVECVFASEIDPDLGPLYLKNFNHPGNHFSGDVTDAKSVSKQTLNEIGSVDVDILCAGFPCQPFSKAGKQKGLECERNGNLFESGVKRLIRLTNPRILLLENVPNLERHDDGRTWKTIQTQLDKIGYEVRHKILSPVQFGVPQVRRRMFIVGWKKSNPPVNKFVWPEPKEIGNLTVRSVVDEKNLSRNTLPSHYIDALDLWSEFLEIIKSAPLPCPLWGMEFGADYEFETPGQQPNNCNFRNTKWRDVKGTFGRPLWSSSTAPSERDEFLRNVPSYARSSKAFPEWKRRFIRQSRDVYENFGSRLSDRWKKRMQELPPSLQKLEWNCGPSTRTRDIGEHMVQFRASGIRIKLDTATPALVTMGSQIPVLGKERRFLSIRECARLQGMGGLDFGNLKDTQIYKALGNAVCVNVVESIGRELAKALG